MQAALLQAAASNFRTLTNVATGGAAAAAAMIPAAAAMMVTQARAGQQMQAIQAETRAKVASVKASQARRERRWKFNKRLAKQDVRIADQKVTLARDDVHITRQRRRISELRVDHAEDVIEFLRDEQFTDRDLYRWMSEQLGQVYRYFLQQAASVAKLAERQLAFRRQEQPSGFIQSNYWNTSGGSGGGGPSTNGQSGGSEDRKGVTGSAQLMEDIWRLDQHEFRTDERRLTVEKTFSLSDLDPLALQQFRETGVLTFSTPLEEFQQDYPAQYHRLIEDVSVNVVALASPTDGVKATLRNAGVSRVVVGDTVFRKKVVSRDPASVVLNPHGSDTDRGVASGGGNERGFRLRPAEGEKLKAFEGMGVETRWQLEMPKAANNLDYETIGDVQFTIRHSAQESPTYREQVTRELGTERSVDRTFSFEDDFADAWYDLHNPEGATDPMAVTFETSADDFPANLSDREIAGIQLYFVGPESDAVSELDVDLTFSPAGSSTTAGGSASPVDGLISTPGASAWTDITGKQPAGTWTLRFPNTPKARSLIQDGALEDLLLIVTAEGEVPQWPA